MAGGGRGGGQGSGNGKGHKQATPEQIAELRERLTGLETTVPSVLRYRWFTDDRVLHRFITARNGNVDIALKMLLEHLEWRITYKLDTILDEDLSGTGVSHEFYWSGFDRDGRPCLVFRACEHRKSDSDGASPTVEEKVRYYCQLLERGFRDFSPAYKFCLILDCRGAGTNVMDRKLFKVATPIIENNFPETQHATYVLPCNGVIMMAWKVISSFIDPGTADKIRLVKDFDDPALVKAFSPETLKAFIAVKPSMAPPQPYVAPDPLSNPPPPSKSSASFLSNNINKVHDDNALPSSDTLEDDSHAGGEGQGHPAQQSRHSAATTLATAVAAAPVVNGGGDDGNRSSSAVPLPPPSPGGSTAYGGGGGAPSPSGSQVPRPEAAGMMQPGLSPAGAAAAVQRRASLAAAAGEAPPSPSGSNVGQHPAAPPSPAGDSLYATSMTGGVEGGESTGGGGGGGGGGRGGEGASNNVFDERFISKSSASHAGGHANGGNFGGGNFGGGGGGGDKLDSSSQRAGSLVSAPRPAAAAAAGPEAATTAPPASASGAPRPPVTVQGNGRPLEGAAAAAAAGVAAGRARPPAATAVRGGSGLTGGGGGFGRGYGEEVHRATSRTLEFTERTGVLYKRRDTLRGRFAYRQQYAVLRFAPPEAASLSSLRRESGSGGVPLPTPPPTLTLLKGRGKSETEKVMSLEGAEVTLGTAMAGDLYPFVMSFPSTAPAPPTISPTRSHRNQPPPPQQQGLPPRRNTEDYMFTGVLDAASAAAASSSPTGKGDGDDPSSSGDRRQQQHVVLGTAAVAGGGGGGNTPSGPMTTASSSTVTSPYVQWPLPSNTTASNASSSSRMMVRGSSSSGRKRSDSMGSSSTGGLAVWQRKTLHLACDTEDEALQWARWLADAVALHDAASEAAAAAERRGESGGAGGLQETAPWRGSTGEAAAVRGKPTIAEQEGSSVPPPPRQGRQENGDDAELSYRSKYEEALDALAAVSGGEGAAPPPRTREGGDAVVVVGPGGGAPTGKKFRTMLDSYRRSKANNNGKKDSSQEPPPFSSSSSSSKPPPPPAPRKSGSLRDTFSRRRGSSRSSLGTSTAAGAVLKGLGEAGGALMSMRDSEISRLRRAYARSELSREEMKRCLRALAVQLREGEDRTGALMADREAALCKLNAKEEEFAKKEAVLEEGKARATAEVQQKEELVTSLQVENEALQAALERLRLDFQEERSLRLQSGPAAAAAAAAASKVRPSTPSRLGIFSRRRGLASRNGGGTPTAAAAAGEGGKPASRHGSVARPPATPSRHNRLLSGPSFLNHHIRSTPGRPGQGGRLAGGSGAIAAAATPGGVGWSSVHGGIGSRHSTAAAAAAGGGSETWVQEGAGAQAVEGLPWILNTDQAWAGGARPPHEVLNHLLEELEGIKAMSGGEKEGGSIAETAAFIEWSHRTGELQEVPPLETVDMPGERAFTEGCLKLLSAHAAAVLRKEPEQLTAREEARMAYAIGGGMYTIERLSAHLDALGAGLPTE